MYRNIKKKIEKWKENKKQKPLIIIGARQVCKTYVIREFARENYKNLVEYNFQNDVKERDYFSSPHSAKDIISYIELNHMDVEFDEQTLIFFDEIQLCPELINSLKFLPSESRCSFICSGSMLGVKLYTMSSWPVGYVELMKMYPMSFMEFVNAVGLNERYLSEVIDAIKDRKEISEALHDKLTSLFDQYMVCGGMPEAVSAYIENGIGPAVKINRRLCNDYRLDITHYADGKTKIKAQECFMKMYLLRFF